MDVEGCFWEGGGGEAEFYQQDPSIQPLRKKVTRFRRMAQFLAVALLLLVAGAVALLIRIQGRCQHSPDSQTKMQPDNNSSAGNVIQGTARLEEKKDNPSATVTAPKHNNTVGKYLQWESVSGNAHCRGFNCTSEDLVVPRRGIYRVFLQITYEIGGAECPDAEMTLKNQVLFSADDYGWDETLLSSVDTVRCGKGPRSKSLYTSASFFLRAHGRLHVTSNYRQFIAKNEHQVFFGAELVSQ